MTYPFERVSIPYPTSPRTSTASSRAGAVSAPSSLTNAVSASETRDLAVLHDGVPAHRSAGLDALAGRAIWHVNTTATGGGVAELLHASVRAHRAAGLRTEWLVSSAEGPFFDITKQLHHQLHGSVGGQVALDAEARAYYRKVTALQAESAWQHVRPGDIVLLHDPQTLGMAPHLVAGGATVLWRSHIGTGQWSDVVAQGWDFLAEYLDAPARLAFSSSTYVPSFIDSARVDIVRPSIDPSSIKCRDLDDHEVHAIVQAIGLETADGPRPQPVEGLDEAAARARTIQDEALRPTDQFVLQLSRWDPLKDMTGVLQAFAQHIAPRSDMHLVLAGPDPDDVPDDFENQHVMSATLAAREQLPADVRRRVHIAILSLQDLDVNARTVNALQRRAVLITQKSLAEGFGIAVTEAMFKRRPVVASAVGGIAEQVEDGVHGRLVEPHDLEGFGDAVVELLDDQPLRLRLVEAAHQHVVEHFLIDRELDDYIGMYLATSR